MFGLFDYGFGGFSGFGGVGGCVVAFIFVVLSLWVVKPNVVFDKNELRYISIANFNVPIFGMSVIIAAILIYYFYALANLYKS